MTESIVDKLLMEAPSDYKPSMNLTAKEMGFFGDKIDNLLNLPSESAYRVGVLPDGYSSFGGWGARFNYNLLSDLKRTVVGFNVLGEKDSGIFPEAINKMSKNMKNFIYTKEALTRKINEMNKSNRQLKFDNQDTVNKLSKGWSGMTSLDKGVALTAGVGALGAIGYGIYKYLQPEDKRVTKTKTSKGVRR